MFLLTVYYDEYDKKKKRILIPIKKIDNIVEFLEDDNIADIVKTVIIIGAESLYCCETIDDLDKKLNGGQNGN